MSAIHPTAVVDARAELGAGVRVGPHAVIGPEVVLGDDCEVGECAVLRGPSAIGKGNVFFPHCVVGTEPQDLKFEGERTTLRMGDGNKVREFVTISRGTRKGGGQTVVGDGNLFMACSHVAHDCEVGNGNILSNNVLLGGHIAIEDHAVLSGAAAVNHFVTIGRAAFVGGLSRIVQDVPPYMIVEGNPARVRGVNLVRLQRLAVPPVRVQALEDAYRTLYRSDRPMRAAIADLRSAGGLTEEVACLLDFLERSSAGEHGRFRETLRKE
ncbi:MAG: acyl-ACP--UDP-N-acetylglucosamine O-acyltransferase [Planctomycetes bacterium]|nr:acyl-ACP--UDP-N-acetylglucosamine O-acyltransferase [Planctomycetota bacterium]